MKHTPIHVLYIITKLELGGAQKVCLSLLEGLEKNENTSATLISSASGILASTVQDKENVVLLSNLERNVSLKKIFKEIRCFFELVGHIKKIKRTHPNLIVHTHSTKAGIIGRWAALCAGVKNRIHTVHGYAFHEHQSKIVWLFIYLCELFTSLITTHFVCVSSHDVKTGIRLLPRFKKKYSIIRASVDTQKFYIPAQRAHLFPHAHHPFVFGTVACFKKQKNLFDLLQAFAYVHEHNPQTRLEIIGDGMLRPVLEQWIAEHRLHAAITLHGWQHDIVPYMMQWHAFALSSLWEGLPCAVVEARLLKLPVLSYNTGGIHDVISSGSNGFLYKQKDWHSLAQGMLAVSKNKQLHMQLQTHSDDLQDFTTTRMIEDHIQLYTSIVHHQKRMV